MKFRFTVRSVLTMVVFFAILLGLGWFLRSVHGNLGEPANALNDIAFLVVLLLPTWVPLSLMDREHRRHAGVRPLLAAVPALWYCLLIVFSEVIPFDWKPRAITLGAVAVLGSLMVFSILVVYGRGWWRILTVPLAIAIAAGAVTFCIG